MIFDHFDLLAPIYDHFIETPDPAKLRELLDLHPGARVLDAGGGTGRVATLLQPLVGELVLIDQSIQMLRKAQGKGLDPLRGDVTRLPFPDASFDRVVVVDALHHFVNPQDSIRDMLRVLKPGGRLVIEEPDIRLGVVKLVALAEWLAAMGSHFFTPAEISAMVESYGARARTEADGQFSAWVIADKPVI
jgi:ubiquinone/menaquinone biosynthesis C-methylase UbiE